MTEIQTYTNAAFGSVRILYEDGKPLFCGADACKALGYKNQHDALTRHCKGVVKRYPLTNGGKQQMNFLPEGDLYRLITHSKLPSAEKFERWVFDEVLPAIRKNGMYGADPAELEQLRQNNQLLREWFSLLADRKRDLVDIQQSIAKARKGRDDAKAQYMAAKASYGKMCDYVRSFEDLALRVQNEINNCIDQIQIVALATPSMDETLNTMLDEMAQQMLTSSKK
ncbi:MAG: Bro-N domain-containing protein [Gemmiger sp.]|uniref:BRO-N domain-containing protein n=1 Tax=Gemmiger sp. TaxID=2049027 RepID=UPI002E7607F6|nr:Bro-N domain-containing protein [Gemmiger sp.]MEE0709935.1 Bro-N domain-containing protein [Gemmiger sp.]